MNKTKCLALLFVASLLASSGAYAATQSVTANMSFDTALTLVKDADIEFGVLQSGIADSYTINTAGVVTPSGSGTVIGGTQAAGQITVTGSPTQTISISTGSYVAASGVTPSAATCSYAGGAAQACDTPLTGLASPGASGRLLTLGVTAAVDGTQAAGSTAAPSFTVTVIYG